MINIEDIKSKFTLRNFAAFILVLFVIHYIPLESRDGVSMIKTAASFMCVYVFIVNGLYMTKALVCVIVYFMAIFSSAILHMESFRASTLLYLLSFLITFVTMYNLVHVKRVFSLPFFTKIVRTLILTLFIVLVVQQLFILLGITYFPLINLVQFVNRGIGANSLTMEPSVAGRMISVLMYAYMECISFREGRRFVLTDLLAPEHRWVTIAYVWSVLTMGSGTAFVAAGILSLYFVNWRNSLVMIPFLVGLVYLGGEMGNDSFERAYNTAEATMTGDLDLVIETDGSAAARIGPLLYTIQNLDLTSSEHWFGQGIDAYGYRTVTTRGFIGEIGSYGFLAYLLGLTLIFSCAIRFFSIPTIMYFLGVGGMTGNIAYGWGILMIFMCVRYFYEHRYDPEVVRADEKEETDNED